MADNIEIEFKLRATRPLEVAVVDATVRELGFGCRAVATSEHVDTYFDDNDGSLGRAGIGLLCYNFMAGTDWVRTKLDLPERGGAKVTGFRLSDVNQALLLTHDASAAMPTQAGEGISESQLWKNLERL